MLGEGNQAFYTSQVTATADTSAWSKVTGVVHNNVDRPCLLFPQNCFKLAIGVPYMNQNGRLIL
jgi:hypothetical protein